MYDNTTILLTSTPPALVAELTHQRPDWQIIALEDAPPVQPLEGKVWVYIDWLCPTMSGLEMCRRLRLAATTRNAHLTLVLDDDTPEAKRRALRAGADDYMPGPLDARRVLQRTEVLASTIAPVRPRLVNGPVQLDRAAHQVRIHGQPVPMRPNEFRLLEHFMDNLDQVFTRSALIESLKKNGSTIDDRTVDVWIGRLRRALAAHGAPNQLRTVRTLGYVMDSRES
ncbi:MAG: response regulator transcription factor [Alphaproteobacteria bacterium]